MKNQNLESTFCRLSNAFTDPNPSPRPKSAAQVAANTYQRGAAMVEQMTGNKVTVPVEKKGELVFPPAKMMLENQDQK